MKTLVALVLLLLSVFDLWNPVLAVSHVKGSAKCFNVDPGKARKIGPDRVIESTGLLAETYDTNGDGKPDLMTMSHVQDTLDSNQATVKHSSKPVFYLVDHNLDGLPDAIYIDKVGQGRCQDIVLYEDLTRPHDAGVNFSQPSETSKGRSI